MKNYDIIIIGGGASGLYCANLLSKKYKIAIIEKENRVGKKILATGNGRCNLSNSKLDSAYYNTNIDSYLKKFDYKKTIDTFNKLGLLTYEDTENRVYPISNSANSVLDVLRLNLTKDIDIYLNSVASKIIKKNKFIIELNEGTTITSSYLIFAVGGNSINLNNLHNKIVKHKKSLVGLNTNVNKYLNGVRVPNVKATLKIGEKNYIENGEILFKENAISGIIIFNLSAHMARIDNYQQKITVDFLPNINISELETLLYKRNIDNKNLQNENILTGIFHPSLCKNLLEKMDFDAKNTKILAFLIKNYDILTKSALDNNQVISGGIELNSLDDNLQSKQTKNLFFTGECIDVDGVCGGFNLQWAWTSAGIVAGYLNSLL